MKLFFLSYINRSGSSFLAQKLSEIKGVFVFPEADFLVEKVLLSNSSIDEVKKALLIGFETDYKLISWNFTQAEKKEILMGESCKELFFRVLSVFQERYSTEEDCLVFKYQKAYVFHDELQTALDGIDYKYIFLVRDPRGIFYSQKQTFNPQTKKMFNKNPLITSYMWREYILSICGDKIQNKFIVKYEEFLYNKEKFFFSLFEGKQINLKTNMSISYYAFLSEENKNIHPDIKKKR